MASSYKRGTELTHKKEFIKIARIGTFKGPSLQEKIISSKLSHMVLEPNFATSKQGWSEGCAKGPCPL